MFSGKFVEKYIERPTEAKGVPILLQGKINYFKEGDAGEKEWKRGPA